MTHEEHAPTVPDAALARQRTRLGRALPAGLRELWDRLGTVLAMSLTWALLLLVALSVAQLLPAALPIALRLILLGGLLAVALSGATVGAFYIAHRAESFEEVSYAAFWQGAWKYGRAAFGLALLHLVLLSVWALNIWFYLSLRNGVGLAAALLCLYALVFWGMQAQYHLPVLIAQEEGVFDDPDRPAKRGVLAAVRRSFYLAMGAPGFALGLFGACLLFTLCLLALPFLFLMLWSGGIAFLLTIPMRMLLARVGILPLPPPEKRDRDKERLVEDA